MKREEEEEEENEEESRDENCEVMEPGIFKNTKPLSTQRDITYNKRKNIHVLLSLFFFNICLTFCSWNNNLFGSTFYHSVFTTFACVSHGYLSALIKYLVVYVQLNYIDFL